MGRKPKQQPGEDAVAMDMVAAKSKKQELAIQRIEEEYGDGQPYERLRLENEIRFYRQQMGESLIETGKRLKRIKANEEHGGFLQVLENLNMAARSAQYAMTAAEKFGNTPTLAHLDSSKIKALTVLDDDSIQALEDGKEAAGVTRDKIEMMSVRELREALRKENRKQEKALKAQEDAIARKEEKINELERRLRYQEPPAREQLAAVALEPLKKKLFEHLLQAQFHLDEAVNAAAAAQKVEGATFPQLQEWAKAHYGQLAPIGELFEELDQALNNCGPDKPENGEQGGRVCTGIMLNG
ncbi:MAG: DUF3102 domain-containing protein [Spirochaetales bacterium]|jgi:uncharacterized protein YdaU (DUF1376 family)|nr:DUF3102 domain-containing protein [Spirochaetales bacterium]